MNKLILSKLHKNIYSEEQGSRQQLRLARGLLCRKLGDYCNSVDKHRKCLTDLFNSTDILLIFIIECMMIFLIQIGSFTASGEIVSKLPVHL